MPDLANSAAGLLGIKTAQQSWANRIKDGAYTSPGGTRIKFDFEDLTREVTKRTTVFEFPGVNDGYVQQNGYGARRYPMVCFFSGKDCDRIATAFESALLEDGIGKLEHPLHGTFNVVPVGDIGRRDDLKTAANQTIVQTTFSTSIPALYPSSLRSGGSEIDAALEGFNVAAAQQFANSVNLKSALNVANLKATIKKFLRDATAALEGISDKVSSVNREFRDAQALVNNGLDVFLGQPLVLAQQCINLVTAPARALAGIESRIAGYQDFAARIFGSSAGQPKQTLVAGSALALRTDRISNDFHAANLFASAAVAGSIVSVRNNQFATRVQAMAAADAVLGQLDSATAWRDDGFSAMGVIPGQVDTGETGQSIRAAAALTAGFLVQTSFTLVPERSIVLDRPRTIVDLAAQLYGSVDDHLDFLIETNNLVGEEILEVPRLRKIVYYPPQAA